MQQYDTDNRTLSASSAEAEQIEQAISSLHRSEHESTDLLAERFLKVYPTLPTQYSAQKTVSASAFYFLTRQPLLGVASVCLLLIVGFFAIEQSATDSESARETHLTLNDRLPDAAGKKPTISEESPLSILIERANVGDTLLLDSANYEESLTISKPIRIAARSGNVRIGDAIARLE